LDVFSLLDYMKYIRVASNDSWNESPLRRLAQHQVPSDLLGRQSWLLEADARMTWANWYIDGLINQTRYVQNDHLGYASLYTEIRQQLVEQDPLTPIDEISNAATAISELAWENISRRREVMRRRISLETREQLWFASEPSPRCYLCGYLFSALARDRYLRRDGSHRAVTWELPLVVDFTRSRGLVTRDLTIEIDHVTPVASGGETHIANLRLACGWCNRTKGSRGNLYDAPAATADVIQVRDIGNVSIPQPLWILRVVATRGRCEHPSGCTATLMDHELFVTPRNLDGTLNPVNCLVYCKVHDPWAIVRYVGRDVFSRKTSIKENAL
jgi:hypothetical protein